MSRDEKKTLVLALLALVAFISEPWHGIPGYFAFCSMVLLGFTPIFNLMEASDLKKVQFPILFFIAGCMAIGIVAGTLGIPAWLAGKLVPTSSRSTAMPVRPCSPIGWASSPTSC